MKLRFLLLAALALTLAVPAAMATTTHESPGDEGSGEVEEPQKDGVEDGEDAEEGDKSEKKAKAKKHKKHKKHKMHRLCRPRVAVVVRGDLVAVDAAAGTLTVLVDKANRHGKRFVASEATFKLAKKGKVRKHGKSTLAHLQELLAGQDGYRVKVMGKACRSEIKDDNETPDLYAKHVKVKPPDMDEDETDEKKEGDEGESGEHEEKPGDTDEKPEGGDAV